MSKENVLMDLDFGEMQETNSLSQDVVADIKTDINSVATDDDNSSKDNDGSDKGQRPDDVKQSVATFDPSELLKNTEVDNPQSDSEEKVSTEDKKTPPRDLPKTSSSSFPYALVFKQLSEEGVLDEFDEETLNKNIEEKGATEAILDVFRDQSKKVVEETLNDLEEDVKLYLEMRENGVDTVVAGKIATDINKYSAIKDEDLEGDENLEKRRQIIGDYYKASTKMSQEDIDEMIEDKIASGKDEKEAKKAKDFMVKHSTEQKKLQEEQAKQESINRQNAVKERTDKLVGFINSNDEFLKDVKVNKQTKQKMVDAATKPYQVIDGRPVSLIDYYRLTKPEQFTSMLAYMAVTGAFEGKWAKPTQAIKTETIKELTSVIESSQTRVKDGKPNMNMGEDNDASSDFDALLSGLKKRK